MGILRRMITSNTRKSFPVKLGTEEISNYSPVTAIRTGDMLDGPAMLDLVVGVEHVGGTVRLTTNAGTTEHHESATVVALRRVKHSRTGDYHLVPVR